MKQETIELPGDEQPSPVGFAASIAACLATPEEMESLRGHTAEIRRILDIADSYTLPRKSVEFREIKQRYIDFPTEENRKKSEAVRDPRATEVALLHQRLRHASIAAAGKIYQAHALPILIAIYRRAHERWSAELDRQKGREERWKLQWEEWGQWAKYYGAGKITLSSITPALAERALELHKALRILDEPLLPTNPPPDIEAKLSRLGLALNQQPPA